MNSLDQRQVSNKRIAACTLIVALFYILLFAFLFIMFVVTSENWVEKFRANASQTIMLCISVLLLYCIIYYYNYFENKAFFSSTRNVVLLYTLVTMAVIVCYLFGLISIYVRPVALLPFLCVFLFDRRQAILINFIFALLMFVIDIYFASFKPITYSSETYFSIIVCFVCNPLAAFMAVKAHTRGKLLLSGCIVAVPTIVVALLLKIPTSSSDWVSLVMAMGLSALGCVLSSVLALALLPAFEYLFNRLTVFRLREMTSPNAPILERLKSEAPGTFNHSLTVAQLAETCAVAIGENAELARACAYYHDVGKIKQPECFTENQSGYNVHDELMPELSADIIRSHARDGYDLLSNAHFPQIVCDVAREHHGTLPMKYFYDKAVRLSGADVNIKDFSYVGPKPHTKIAAIVMIADAAEASSRTVSNRSPEVIEKIVRSIIEERMDLDQFEDCDITIRELAVIRQTLVEALSGVYHHRVEYPAIRFKRTGVSKDEEESKIDG